ncbi:MAG TPA: FtsX-like permease family protein [Methanoregulaceae archaeon]|nr:FtsX-like permease family protein [Methanoregulaceae archaeon]
MDYLIFIMSGIRNKPGRNLATVFCFAFIAANIFSGQYLMAGASDSLDQGISRMGADLLVVPPHYLVFLKGAGSDNTMAIVRVEPSIYRVNANVMDKILQVQGVSETSPQLFVTTVDIPELSPSPIDIFAIDPATDFSIQPWLRHPLRNPLGHDEVIVGHEITGEESSKISLYGHTYTIAGRLDPSQSAADNTLFLRLDDAYALAAEDGIVKSGPRISPGEVSAILVRLEPGEDPDLAEVRIKHLFPPTSFTVIGRHFSLDPIAKDIQGLPDLLNYISVIVIVAAFPLIALIAAMVAHERQREIGILRTMGAKKNIIIFLVIAESLSLAAIGGIIGVCASLIILMLLNAQGSLNGVLQVSFQMPGTAAIGMMAAMALFVVIAIGCISSLYPAYRSSTMNPYEAIRSEKL